MLELLKRGQAVRALARAGSDRSELLAFFERFDGVGGKLAERIEWQTGDGKKGNDVIAHELFHQWFGDFVTAESWSNLPLNESFATYGEYLWNEYKEGRDARSEERRVGKEC